MPSPEQLSAFVDWYQRCITGDETFRSGTSAQIFLDPFLREFLANGAYYHTQRDCDCEPKGAERVLKR